MKKRERLAPLPSNAKTGFLIRFLGQIYFAGGPAEGGTESPPFGP